MNICRAPHLEVSPKRFTMATIELFSASEHTHSVPAVCDFERVTVCDFERVTVAFHSAF